MNSNSEENYNEKRHYEECVLVNQICEMIFFCIWTKNDRQLDVHLKLLNALSREWALTENCDYAFLEHCPFLYLQGCN